MLFADEKGKVVEINRMEYVTDPGYYSAVENMYKIYVTHSSNVSSTSVPNLRMNNLEVLSQVVSLPSSSPIKDGHRVNK